MISPLQSLQTVKRQSVSSWSPCAAKHFSSDSYAITSPFVVVTVIDAYTPTSVLASPATVPLGTTVVLVCRVGGVASGTQLSYTWICPNGPCDVGEGNNPNRKTYGDRMVLNVLTSRDEGMYTCLVRDRPERAHRSNFVLRVEGNSNTTAHMLVKICTNTVQPLCIHPSILNLLIMYVGCCVPV